MTEDHGGEHHTQTRPIGSAASFTWTYYVGLSRIKPSNHDLACLTHVATDLVLNFSAVAIRPALDSVESSRPAVSVIATITGPPKFRYRWPSVPTLERTDQQHREYGTSMIAAGDCP